MNKFGDGIDWEKFAVEILHDTDGNKDKIFFKYEDKKEIIQHIEKYIDKTHTNKVLDIGCNIGRWANLLKERGFYYTGIDQASAIIIAIKIFPEGIFYKGFLWNMHFDNEFNLVFCNNVLQHNTLQEKHKMLPIIYKSLKREGILFINESTTIKPTKTQLTHEGWIQLMNDYKLQFLESWQPNNFQLDECYLFRKS